jgi:hypothetical protein
MKTWYAIGWLLIATATLAAQDPPPPPAATAEVASLKVRVVVSRYQGEKRVSAVPFEMTVRSDGARAQLRMGNEVPVPFITAGTDPKQPPPPGSVTYNYRPVGTNIDVTAAPGSNERFKLDILLEDSSVVLDKTDQPVMPALAGAPIFRSFRATNTLLLRNGESTDFTVATDRITGDIIRVGVTLLTVTK